MISSNRSADRTVSANGITYLFFSGTSYLGINNDHAFRNLLEQGMNNYGTNYSTSRKSNLQLKVYDEAEISFAELTGSEAALTLSSGFMAGQLVIRALEHSGKFIYAPDTHPAIWLQPENFYHDDFNEWAGSLNQRINEVSEETIIILTNSVDSLTARQYRFDWIKHLPVNKKIYLIVDDSHGMGVLNNGRGIFPSLPEMKNVERIVISSVGKAMGIPGGAIFASRDMIDTFKKSPWFGTSSPVSPAYLQAFLGAGKVYAAARERLFKNIETFAGLVKETQLFRYIPGYPVFYTRENDLYEFLLKRRILISSFAYPSPEDEPITRVVINSHHTDADIKMLAEAIGDYQEGISG